MLKKTFILGNKERFVNAISSGFVLIWGMCALLAVSLIFISLFEMENLRLKFAEKKHEELCRKISEENRLYENFGMGIEENASH